MTQEEFIEVLDEKGYSYEIEGNKIVVAHDASVWLNPLETLPSVVEFKNEGDVYLRSLTSLPPGVEFKNEDNVNLYSLIGGWFIEWEGNIEGIEPKRLLNKMISIGLFDRR